MSLYKDKVKHVAALREMNDTARQTIEEINRTIEEERRRMASECLTVKIGDMLFDLATLEKVGRVTEIRPVPNDDGVGEAVLDYVIVYQGVGITGSLIVSESDQKYGTLEEFRVAFNEKMAAVIDLMKVPGVA